jgi:phosphoserine phosphatase
MKRLAVIDLDGTLIRCDSFRQLVLRHVHRPQILFASILRSAGLIDRRCFAETVHRALVDRLSDRGYVGKFVDGLQQYTNSAVALRAREYSDDGAMVVLLSASPGEYVGLIAQRLGLDAGHGSDWRDGAYSHLYGASKIAFLEAHYPETRFEWAFAIADSASDWPMLNRFRQGVRVP